MTPAQRAHLAIDGRAAQQRERDLRRLSRTLGEVAPAEVERLVEGARRWGRLTLNFHPDRIDRDGRTVSQGLLRSGRYRPQSETGLSNGGRFAVPGGQRIEWERTLFDGAYGDRGYGDEPARADEDTAELTRPVYGALDLTNDLHGGSPRFGSSFIVLDPSCFARTTFCVGDSHVGPTDVGTGEQFTGILAGLFEQGLAGRGLDRDLTVADLRRLLNDGPRNGPPGRCLDGYIEAQVHGGVSLARDVTAIVLDPSFGGSTVEQTLAAAADRFGFQLGHHCGSELDALAIPDGFRGPTVAKLGRDLANGDGMLDAATIGRSAARIPFTPPSVEGDPADGPLQQHKYLWHCVLHFGRDAPGGDAGPTPVAGSPEVPGPGGTSDR